MGSRSFGDAFGKARQGQCRDVDVWVVVLCQMCEDLTHQRREFEALARISASNDDPAVEPVDDEGTVGRVGPRANLSVENGWHHGGNVVADAVPDGGGAYR